MLDEAKQVKASIQDLERSHTLSDYEAVDVVWVAIIRIANLQNGQGEHQRLLALLDLLSAEAAANIVTSQGTDTLLNLDPPLEAIRSFVHERLDVQKTANELAAVKAIRIADPKAALAQLAETLKRVRNRRAHGFKTPEGPRDQVILGATADILRRVCDLAIQQRT
ncbi:hypothetical protein ACPPVV_18775 [Rhodanobacter sp. Col0626]|uniref:hypothetical protein n=1 Tax=Rhodanobacter sp. Col0626 TaxID=3415679 RepID=UPI003CF00D87